MKKWIPLLLAAFVMCPNLDAAAQGGRYQATALDSEGRTLKNTTVRVCDEPATGAPCTPLSSVFTDSALSNVKSNPFTTDGNGQFFFYAASGLYHIQITAGSTIQTFPDVLLPDSSGVLGGLGTPDAILFVNSAGSIGEDPTQFCWDDTTNRVGIGNCSPTVPLDVTGAITASGTITGGAVTTAGIVTGADFTWTGATATVIPFIGASGVFTEDPTGLCFDSGNDRIGIGVCPPTVSLHVLGAGFTLDNPLDGPATIIVDSGATTPQSSCSFDLQDQGVSFWTFCKNSLNDLILTNVATGATIFDFKDTGNLSIFVGAQSGSLRIRDFGGLDLMTIADGGSVGIATITGTLTVDGISTLTGAVTGSSTINAVTGFQHNALAPIGNVLRGDGTNFVSAVLARADVSGTTTVAQGGTGQTAVTDDNLWVLNGTIAELKALPDCETAVIDSVTYNTSTNAFGCNVQVVTNHTVLIGTGATRTPDVLVDCNTTGDAVTYDTTGRNFDCDRLQQGWRAGVFEEAPATTGAQDDVPLPVPNYCATNITVNRVVISARDDGSTNTTYNVIRFNSSGASQGNIFGGTQTFTGGGGNYQTDTVTTSTATATDYFLMNVISVGDSAGLTFIVEGKCDVI